MNTLLIEMYKIFMYKKMEVVPSEDEKKELLGYNDFLYLINFGEGTLVNEECFAEFYFLLMTSEFELATVLLSKPYAAKIREYLNKLFIDEDTSLLKTILFNNDIVILSIKSALERALDGIAL
jgi:hypothetical protein